MSENDRWEPHCCGDWATYVEVEPMSNQSTSWPFDQPPNCATLTMRQVLARVEPILLVSHDAEDHGWQFIGSTDANMEDGRVVSLAEIVALDPGVLELADLPPGFQAVRERPGKPWVRRISPPEPGY